MARFTSQPKIDEPVVSPTMAAQSKPSAKAAAVAEDMGDDEMAILRKQLEED